LPLHRSCSTVGRINGHIDWRAPQWIPWPNSAEGRCLVPQDHATMAGRVSLVLLDPSSGTVDLVCEHLPPHVHFTASQCGQWVAWCGQHDERGHGGVFIRRMRPSVGPPVKVFNGNAQGMTWGGDRLGLLLTAPDSDELLWAVCDPPRLPTDLPKLTVAPKAFEPHAVFARRVLPFFDQFERRQRFWSPDNDAVVFTTSASEVWIQPFPRNSSWENAADHPLSSLVGATESTRGAPPAVRVTLGCIACWSPV